MPKSFLFTHRRYNVSPIPPSAADETLLTRTSDNEDDPVANKQQQGSKIQQRQRRSYLPLSPGQGSEAELKSPGRPQSARISPVISCTNNNLQNGRHTIPEEMYNLFQLAEVSLAASGGNEFRSVLDRWRHQGLARALSSPAVKMLDMSTVPVLDKPLDLSRDPSTTSSNEVRILTPSPSPTPSESHLSTNLGLRKHTQQQQQSAGPNGSEDEEDEEEDEELDASDSCWSPETSCKSVIVKGSAGSTGSADINPDGHECPDCGKRYSTSSNLARHRQTHRSPADQKARRCPHCDKVYVSVPAFSMHVRTHSQGCKCPYCGKSFSRPWLLQGHIRTHTGEKPFTCQICEKAFADKSNLRAHIQTHSNLKPFTCQRCGKAFALKSYLYKHEESSCMKMVSKSSTKDD